MLYHNLWGCSFLCIQDDLDTIHRTWLCSDEEIKSALKEALKAGYRLIDCALAYGNEVAIGKALQDCFKEGIVKREDVFITSKLWYNIMSLNIIIDSGYEDQLEQYKGLGSRL